MRKQIGREGEYRRAYAEALRRAPKLERQMDDASCTPPEKRDLVFEEKKLKKKAAEFVDEYAEAIVGNAIQGSIESGEAARVGERIRDLDPFVSAELLLTVLKTPDAAPLTSDRFMNGICSLDAQIAGALLYEIRLTGNADALTDGRLFERRAADFLNALGPEAASEWLNSVGTTGKVGTLTSAAATSGEVLKAVRGDAKIASELSTAMGETGRLDVLAEKGFLERLNGLASNVASELLSAIWCTGRVDALANAGTMGRIAAGALDVWNGAARASFGRTGGVALPVVVMVRLGGGEHDRGTKRVMKSLMNAGFEVAYLRNPNGHCDIVNAAVREKAVAIGFSLMDDSLQRTISKTAYSVGAMGGRGISVFGGGWIAPRTSAKLRQQGVKLFGSGATEAGMMEFLGASASQRGGERARESGGHAKAGVWSEGSATQGARTGYGIAAPSGAFTRTPAAASSVMTGNAAQFGPGAIRAAGVATQAGGAISHVMRTATVAMAKEGAKGAAGIGALSVKAGSLNGALGFSEGVRRSIPNEGGAASIRTGGQPASASVIGLAHKGSEEIRQSLDSGRVLKTAVAGAGSAKVGERKAVAGTVNVRASASQMMVMEWLAGTENRASAERRTRDVATALAELRIGVRTAEAAILFASGSGRTNAERETATIRALTGNAAKAQVRKDVPEQVQHAAEGQRTNKRIASFLAEGKSDQMAPAGRTTGNTPIALSRAAQEGAAGRKTARDSLEGGMTIASRHSGMTAGTVRYNEPESVRSARTSLSGEPERERIRSRASGSSGQGLGPETPDELFGLRRSERGQVLRLQSRMKGQAERRSAPKTHPRIAWNFGAAIGSASLWLARIRQDMRRSRLERLIAKSAESGRRLEGEASRFGMDLQRSKADDPYRVLGVGRASDQKEIRSAYIGLVKKYHPDVSSEAGAEEMTKRINEAYALLKDERQRMDYDRDLGEGVGAPKADLARKLSQELMDNYLKEREKDFDRFNETVSVPLEMDVIREAVDGVCDWNGRFGKVADRMFGNTARIGKSVRRLVEINRRILQAEKDGAALSRLRENERRLEELAQAYEEMERTVSAVIEGVRKGISVEENRVAERLRESIA